MLKKIYAMYNKIARHAAFGKNNASDIDGHAKASIICKARCIFFVFSTKIGYATTQKNTPIIILIYHLKK